MPPKDLVTGLYTPNYDSPFYKDYYIKPGQRSTKPIRIKKEKVNKNVTSNENTGDNKENNEKKEEEKKEDNNEDISTEEKINFHMDFLNSINCYCYFILW